MSTVSGHSGPHDIPAYETSLRHRSGEPGISRFFLGGIAGTVAITLMMYFVDSLVRGRTIDIARILVMMLGSPRGAGGTGNGILRQFLCSLAGELLGFFPPLARPAIWGQVV
jgi:hypothetical protein